MEKLHAVTQEKVKNIDMCFSYCDGRNFSRNSQRRISTHKIELKIATDTATYTD